MSNPSGRLFSTRAKIIIIAMVALGLFAAIAQLLVDDEDSIISVSGDSYSRSGLGHKALLLLLREQGIPVQVNRHPHGRGIGKNDLLLVLEPHIPLNETKRLSDLLEGKRRVLFALPKRTGMQSMRNPGWIFQSRLIDTPRVERVAEQVLEEPRVTRPNTPLKWKAGVHEHEPTIESTQLLVASELEPIIETNDGVLLGELRSERPDASVQEGLYLLSDPDLFNNHGLRRGENARLMLDIVEGLLPTEGTVYFDESLHGFGQVRSLVALMIAPPYLGVLILVVLVTALVSWMTLVPFGTPLEAGPGERPAVREAMSGHQTLVENSGRLLVAGGYKRHLVEQYQWSIMEEVGLRVGIRHEGERSLEGMGRLRHRLNQVLEHRGVTKRLPDPMRARGNLQAHARACYEWMKGVVDEH